MVLGSGTYRPYKHRDMPAFSLVRKWSRDRKVWWEGPAHTSTSLVNSFMPCPWAFFTRTLEKFFLFSAACDVGIFPTLKSPRTLFEKLAKAFAVPFLQTSSDLVDQHLCPDFFPEERPWASRAVNQVDLQICWPKREGVNYFLKIIFWMESSCQNNWVCHRKS